MTLENHNSEALRNMDDDVEGRIYSDTGPGAWVYMWVLEHIQGAEFQVYAALRSFCDASGKCFPTSRTIAERACVSIHTARKAIQKMRKIGIVRTTEIHRPSDGSLAGFNYFLPSLPIPPGRTPEVTGVVPGGDPRVTSGGDGGATPIPPKNLTKELNQLTKEPLRAARSAAASVVDDPRPDVDEILSHFNASLVRRGCKPKKRTKADVDAARLMIDRDGLSVDKIKSGIDWAAGDHFWSAHILSVAKFRQKYETLKLLYAKGGSSRSGPHRAYQDPADLSAYLEDL